MRVPSQGHRPHTTTSYGYSTTNWHTPSVVHSTMPGHAVLLAMGPPSHCRSRGCSSRCWGIDQPSMTTDQRHPLKRHARCAGRRTWSRTVSREKDESTAQRCYYVHSATTASMKPRDITGRPNLAEEQSRAQFISHHPKSRPSLVVPSSTTLTNSG